jgi:hypothetical protein
MIGAALIAVFACAGCSGGDMSSPPDQSVSRDLGVADLSAGDLTVGDLSVGDLAGGDLATPPTSWTIVGTGSGLGGGVSTGVNLQLEGAIGVPGPRSVSAGAGFSVEPLIPGR